MKGMVGMGHVADKVADHIEFLQFERENESPEVRRNRPPEHFVLTGNPGTGKSQLASILAEAMAGIEEGRSSEVVEFSAAQLAGAQYMGEAVQRIQEFVDRNPGKVILIDEAHQLKDPTSYGPAVLRALIPMMTQKGPKAPQFIFAGYPGLERDLGNLDPGFGSRISETFDMPDYDTDDLVKIAHTKMSDPVSPGAEAVLRTAIAKLPVFERGKQEKFANGRGVERFMDKVRKQRGLRIQRARQSGEDSKAVDWGYTAEDFANGFNQLGLGTLSVPKKKTAAPKAAPEPAAAPAGSLKPVSAPDKPYFGAQSKGPEPNRRRKRSTI